jgi:hypothetical protein
MKIWLDDLRPAPDHTWTAVTTPSAAIGLLESGEVEVISFDHDLGFEGKTELTGYSVLLWIEEAVALRGFSPPEMLVHSANPPGHERLLRGIEAINRRA